jgi:GDPmannose 4,6-dehydratase
MQNAPKRAMIIGINGQDGSFLAELLLAKGYEVHGIIRQTSQFNRNRIDATRKRAQENDQAFFLHYGDLGDTSSLHFAIEKCRPDEIYNLASLSHVVVSETQPEYATEINGMAVLRILEAIKHYVPHVRFYQASTSELFGQAKESPQTEETPFHPRSAYGIAKLYGYWIVRHYREQYGIYASNGILYNHESPRRGENFVTRKITYSLARIKAGIQSILELGNLDSLRDWGYAGDYVDAMWRILQQDNSDDYVIATGKTHSVREFVSIAAEAASISLVWQGKGMNEVGIDRNTNKIIVRVNPDYYRPAEKFPLVGCANKALYKLGWQPTMQFEDLVKQMMQEDLKHVGRLV